jgi:hypothetical protein
MERDALDSRPAPRPILLLRRSGTGADAAARRIPPPALSPPAPLSPARSRPAPSPAAPAAPSSPVPSPPAPSPPALLSPAAPPAGGAVLPASLKPVPAALLSVPAAAAPAAANPVVTLSPSSASIGSSTTHPPPPTSLPFKSCIAPAGGEAGDERRLPPPPPPSPPSLSPPSPPPLPIATPGDENASAKFLGGSNPATPATLAAGVSHPLPLTVRGRPLCSTDDALVSAALAGVRSALQRRVVKIALSLVFYTARKLGMDKAAVRWTVGRRKQPARRGVTPRRPLSRLLVSRARASASQGSALARVPELIGGGCVFFVVFSQPVTLFEKEKCAERETLSPARTSRATATPSQKCSRGTAHSSSARNVVARRCCAPFETAVFSFLFTFPRLTNLKK